MCGIAGYMGPKEIDINRIYNCLALMRQRGPDHAEYRRWLNPAGNQVLLLHTRLSIIDLEERSNQPFQWDNNCIVYNGELYNYVELRQERAARGVAYRTQSDTEVLLGIINQEGWGGLERCEGMWAFAVYDEEKGVLSLCRDRFGEKPLYVYRDATGFYFGSEVKFITALLGRSLPVNMEHLYRYLVNGYKSLYKNGETFFQGLRELEPGTVLHLEAQGGERQEVFWEPRYCPDDQLTLPEVINGVRCRLIRSVELRLRADVPLAFCMSGGVDSNSLISIAKNIFGYDVHGFTIVNKDSRYEEQEMVEYAVAQLGIRHTAVPVDTTAFLSRLRNLVRYHDAPVYTIAYYAHWLLMESVAAQGYRIAVSGTAADELFTGYYDHHLAYLYDIYQNPVLYVAAREAWQEKVLPLVRNPYLQDPDLFLNDPDWREHIYYEADSFARYLKVGWFEPFSEKFYTDSLLRNRMLNEMFFEAVPVILHEDDLNAMYFSVENRSPYLDRQLFEFCYRIPSQHLIHNGLAKAVLREAMRGIVPAKVLENPRKVGFNAPIYDFLDIQDPEVREALLADSPIFEHVHREKIIDLLGKSQLPNSESKFLFYFLSSKMFLEEFGA